MFPDELVERAEKENADSGIGGLDGYFNQVLNRKNLYLDWILVLIFIQDKEASIIWV